ncbi:MAG TPA: GntR family transcriptional regulator [Candidatus Tetragenococcus pullicola]|nr:GntR family transcriptional regulator [Candidatus Tetragenococcus pullicola]
MKPKYEQLADNLRKQILSGVYQKNELIPSENKLQEKYGLSRYTVRQAIGVLVEEGLLRKERGAGTFVSKIDQGTKTIGVIMTYLSDYIFPSIIRGLEKELSQQGYSLILGTTNNDPDQEKACLKRMLNQKVDGFIIEPTKSNQYNPNLAYYSMIKERNIPVLMINAYYEALEVPHICVNDTKSGYLATKYLLNHHHEHILLVTKIDDLQGKYRLKGFIKAIQECGKTFEPEDIITYTTESREEMIAKVVKRFEKAQNVPTSIVAYNDEMATSLIQALLEKGYKVPEDVSVIGNDDSALSRNGQTKLTTFTHPKEKMGELASQYIIKAIEGQQIDSFYFEPKIVERESVRSVDKK